MATRVVGLTFNPVQENTYLVFDEVSREAIVFDPGCFGEAEEVRLAETISELELRPVKLINTHCHFDHVFGNAFVAKRYGLELGCHRDELLILEAAPVTLQLYGIPPMTPSPKPDYFIEEGDTVRLGDAEFEVLRCPGHSPGSLCFLNRAEKYVISGDVLFRRSIGRTDLPLSDPTALVPAIKEKLMPLPDDTLVYPGHGPTTTIGEERRENPFF